MLESIRIPLETLRISDAKKTFDRSDRSNKSKYLTGLRYYIEIKVLVVDESIARSLFRTDYNIATPSLVKELGAL